MKKKNIFIGAIIVCILAFVYYLNNRITISVIIPVYNAEKYLHRCLDSIFAQSGSFEIIAVNDGSTDKSLQILQEYAKKHSNLHIINQKNQGISAARNAGMAAAKNKYITFVDNDDWLEPNAFSQVRDSIKRDNPDILLSSFYGVYDREWVRQTQGEEVAQHILEDRKVPDSDMARLALFSPFNAKDAYRDLYYGGTWVVHSFFSKKFLNENKLHFPSGKDIMEDLIFMYRSYAHNPRISILYEPIYNYYNRVDSASKSVATLNVLEDRMSYMRQTQEYKNTSRQIQMYIDDSFLGTLFISIANLQRHGLPLSTGIEKIYRAYKLMNKYNPEELKNSRNYTKLKALLQKRGVNLPL